MANMQAWGYAGAQGGLSKHLRLRSDVPKPDGSSLQPNQILIETHSVSLNPADYKVAAFPILGKMIYPDIPGTDYAGRVAAVHSSITNFKVGQAVFGRINVFQFGKKKNGVLAQYLIADTEECALIPEGVSLDEAAAIGTAGLTAYDSLQLGNLRDKHVFINGGSGGTGIFAIQIAKAIGAKVTTTCSTDNVALCKELGADEVIDYKTTNVLDVLKSGGPVFDYAIDNVGTDLTLLKQAGTYLKPKADYVQVGGSGAVIIKARAIAISPCLRPGKNPVTMIAVNQKAKSMARVARWVDEGAVKVVFDSKYSFADTPKAFARVETGRAKGKVIVHVKDPDTTPEEHDEPTTTDVADAAADITLNEKEIAVPSAQPVVEPVSEKHTAMTQHADVSDDARSAEDFREAEESGAGISRVDTAAHPHNEKAAGPSA